MRPDYIDRFDLKNFKRLRDSSRNYPEAYVGHLASQTIVSHLVIPTGLAPKDLPWQDDAMVDVEGVLGKPGAAYDADAFTRDDMWRFLEGSRASVFCQRGSRTTWRQVFSIGVKDYAAALFGGPHASAIVTWHERRDVAHRTASTFLRTSPGTCASRSNAPRPTAPASPTVYSIDGNRFVPGNDPSRAGGDVWTADAAMEIMKREKWSGLFLTFGGIDRIAHMLGEQDGHGLTSVPASTGSRDAFASPTNNSAACSPRSRRKASQIGRSWSSPPIMAARRTIRTWATTGSDLLPVR